jgi:ABC-type Fe3+/spermidine/putrescine transport system ATPase subunit
LRTIHREIRFTAIYVTHDQTEAFALGSQIAVMNRGRIEQLGTPDDVYSRPSTEYVAKFLGIRNVLSDETTKGVPAILKKLLSQLNVDEGADTSVFVRPEHINLDSNLNPDKANLQFGTGDILDCVNLGSTAEYSVEVDGIQLIAVRSTSAEPLRIGERVHVTVRRNHGLVYRRGHLLQK